MAPAPSKKYYYIMKRFWKLRPGRFLKSMLTLNLHHMVNSKKLFKETFFSDDIDDEKLSRYYNHSDNESFLLFLNIIIGDLFNFLIKPHKITSPILVIGALDDRIVSMDDIAITVSDLKAGVQLFDRIAHDIMLENRWQVVADAIIRWLKSCMIDHGRIHTLE